MDRVRDLDALRLEQVGELRARRAAPARPRARSPARRRPCARTRASRRRPRRVALRTCRRRRPPRPRPPARVTWPNAPKRTFVIERFIARPIIIVSNVPDAPTSMPLTISTLFSSSKPPRPTASPVNAFSSEITTGMSAPPIGRTNRTPKSSAPATSAHSSHSSCTPATSAMPARDAREEERRVDELLARIRDRPAADQLLQLRERDHRARERDRADQRRRARSRAPMSTFGAPGLGEDAVQLRERDRAPPRRRRRR